jgi:copper(I)-binding protein
LINLYVVKLILMKEILMKSLLSFWVSAMLFAINAWAGEVTVSDAWVRATAPGQDNGSLQFSITSQKEARLVGASTPAAAKAELHAMSHENGMMKMRAVDAISLPAGKVIDLAASGKHVMLIGLKQPLRAGDSVPFTLSVEYADNSKVTVNARAEVKSLTAPHDTHRQHDMQDMPGM